MLALINMKNLIFLVLFFVVTGCSDEEPVVEEPVVEEPVVEEPVVEEPVVESYFVSVHISGLTGSIVIKNKEEVLTVSVDGKFKFIQTVAINDTYDVIIDASPEGQVCSINNSTGNYEYLAEQEIQIKCMPNTLMLDSSMNGLPEDKELMVNLSNLSSVRLHKFLFSDIDLLGFHNTAIESISTVAGLFVKDGGINAYYGVTRSGKHCRLFRYNIDTGKVDLIKDIESSAGSWSIKRSGDFLYIGTYNSASVHQFNLSTNEMLELAEMPDEKYIWDMAMEDGLLYVGTYPSAKLFSLNTANQEIIDLGNMSDRAEAKYIRALASHNKKIYIGIGTHAELIEYDILTRTKTPIPLPEGNTDSFVYQLKIQSDLLFIGLSPSTDVLVYDLSTKQYIYHLEDIKKQPVSLPSFNQDTYQISLRGYLLEYDKKENMLKRVSFDFGVAPHFINETEIASVNENGLYFEATYQGERTTEIDFLSNGLNGIPAQPYSMLAFECKVFIGERRLKVVDLKQENSFLNLIHGEPKVMSVVNGNLFTANYTGAQVWKYPLYLFDNDFSQNLSTENYLFAELDNNQNRPLSMDSNIDSLIIGTEPHYGTYGGAFTVLTPYVNEQFTLSDAAIKHSVSSVAFDKGNVGIAYIGTSDRGGSGSQPLDESAYLIKWNLFEKSEEFRIQPDLNTHKIIKIFTIKDGNNLLILTENGMIISIDKETGEVKKKSERFFRDILISSDGNLYGLDANSIYTIDILSLDSKVLIDGFNNLSFLIEDSATASIFFLNDYNLYSLFFSPQLCDI